MVQSQEMKSPYPMMRLEAIRKRPRRFAATQNQIWRPLCMHHCLCICSVWTSANGHSSTIETRPYCPLSKSGISAITNVRTWKHSLKSPTVNNHNYGIRDHQQRNARNETTHFGHPRSKQTHSGDCPNAPSAIRWRNLPHRARGLRTPFSSVRVPCRTIGTRVLFPTPRLRGKFFIDSLT